MDVSRMVFKNKGVCCGSVDKLNKLNQNNKQIEWAPFVLLLFYFYVSGRANRVPLFFSSPFANDKVPLFIVNVRLSFTKRSCDPIYLGQDILNFFEFVDS